MMAFFSLRFFFGSSPAAVFRRAVSAIVPPLSFRKSRRFGAGVIAWFLGTCCPMDWIVVVNCMMQPILCHSQGETVKTHKDSAERLVSHKRFRSILAFFAVVRLDVLPNLCG